MRELDAESDDYKWMHIGQPSPGPSGPVAMRFDRDGRTAAAPAERIGNGGARPTYNGGSAFFLARPLPLHARSARQSEP
ncbi:hypothetical protein [Burkholderia anthina]|uniref:hypothetical protein n=1 Tax=Burkholderia anthina TaxID=179879 RepID=UPI00158C82CF|nr:hypothetical protein [Burkholderia anthina]